MGVVLIFFFPERLFIILFKHTVTKGGSFPPTAQVPQPGDYRAPLLHPLFYACGRFRFTCKTLCSEEFGKAMSHPKAPTISAPQELSPSSSLKAQLL